MFKHRGMDATLCDGSMTCISRHVLKLLRRVARGEIYMYISAIATTGVRYSNSDNGASF